MFLRISVYRLYNVKNKDGILPLRFAQGQNDRKEGQNDRKEGQNDIFSCHPEAQAEGSHKRRGFFPFASAQGQNDRKEGQNDIFSCHPEAQAEGSHKRKGFFPFASLRVRMTGKRVRMTSFHVTLRRKPKGLIKGRDSSPSLRSGSE